MPVAAILDTGKAIFLWFGPLTSDVVRKLAVGTTKEYVRRLEPERGLHLENIQFVTKGEEPFAFQRAFQGWAKTKFHAQDLARPIEYLGHVLDPLPMRPVPEGARLNVPHRSIRTGSQRMSIISSASDGPLELDESIRSFASQLDVDSFISQGSPLAGDIVMVDGQAVEKRRSSTGSRRRTARRNWSSSLNAVTLCLSLGSTGHGMAKQSPRAASSSPVSASGGSAFNSAADRDSCSPAPTSPPDGVDSSVKRSAVARERLREKIRQRVEQQAPAPGVLKEGTDCQNQSDADESSL